MKKAQRLFWFGLFMFLVLCILILWAAGTTRDRAQQTQQYYDTLKTWDAENYGTMTAEAK